MHNEPIINQEPHIQEPHIPVTSGLGSGMGSTVAGEYFITKDAPLGNMPVHQQPLVGQQPFVSTGPQLVTETAVHPVYDEKGRMHLPRDLKEENLLNQGEPVQQKQGFGTKIKNMLHIGRHKNEGINEPIVTNEPVIMGQPTTMMGQPGYVGDDDFKHTHTIKAGKTITGKEKIKEVEKIVR